MGKERIDLLWYTRIPYKYTVYRILTYHLTYTSGKPTQHVCGCRDWHTLDVGAVMMTVLSPNPYGKDFVVLRCLQQPGCACLSRLAYKLKAAQRLYLYKDKPAAPAKPECNETCFCSCRLQSSCTFQFQFAIVKSIQHTPFTLNIATCYEFNR